MDSLEAYDQHDDEQKESAGYKALLITGACILVIVAFIAMVRVGWKLTALRNQTGPIVKWLLISGLIIGGLIALFLITLNARGKRNEKNTNNE